MSRTDQYVGIDGEARVADHLAPRVSLFPHDYRMWAANGIYGGRGGHTFYRRGPTGIVRSGRRELDANPYAAGGPALHGTGLAVNGDMDRDWNATLPVTPGVGGWSARYSGHFNVATTGSYELQASTRGSKARVWIDDVIVADTFGET